jgi:pimeloyl-ACP methyl ester carboxylesterase
MSPPTWILLRGLTRESGHWGAFPALLRAQMPEARVLAIDLPGCGRLHEAASPMRIEAIVAHCRAQLAALGVAPPYHLLALSLGGMVAVEWAQRHGDELAACVLINTSMRPFSPWFHRLRPANYGTLLGLAWPGHTGRSREQAVLRLTSSKQQDHAAVVDEWVRLREAHPVAPANALRQLVAAARYRAPARPPAVPLLVLNGCGDTLVDPRCSQRLAGQWHTDFAQHPQAGHDLPLDDGPWLAAQVARWRPRPCA